MGNGCIVFLTSALVGGEWSVSRPGRFTTGERAPHTHYIGAGWPPNPVWTTWKGEISCPYLDSNSDPSAVQPIANRYTDSTIHNKYLTSWAWYALRNARSSSPKESLLFSDYNKTLRVSVHFTKVFFFNMADQMSTKYVQRLWACYLRTGILQHKVNRICATFLRMLKNVQNYRPNTFAEYLKEVYWQRCAINICDKPLCRSIDLVAAMRGRT
jgi:hypothetical protein